MPERSWQRYRPPATATTDVVYESDATGVIQWISPSVRDMLGWEPEQLEGRPASTLIHPLDLERIEALRASMYADGSAHHDVTCMVCTANARCSTRTARSTGPGHPDRRARSRLRTARPGHVEPGQSHTGARH